MKKPSLTTMLLLTLTALVLISVIIRTIYATRAKPDINVVADSLVRRPEQLSRYKYYNESETDTIAFTDSITRMSIANEGSGYTTAPQPSNSNHSIGYPNNDGKWVVDTVSCLFEHSQIPVINK